MELYQLRSFLVVAECEHLTRAAERLHVSQPALSAQIRALEDELEVALFERRPSGMSLTPAGRRLLSHASQVVASAQELRNEARAIKGEVAGAVRVGTLVDAEFIRLPEVLNTAVELYPLLELQLHREVSGAAFEEVRSGALDASFYYGDLSHSSVASLPLRDIAYRIAAPAAWADRLRGAGPVALASEPWIMAPPISTHHQLARTWFAEAGVEPTTVVEADDDTVISSLVVAGLGIALIREDVAQARADAGELYLLPDVRLRTRLQFIYLRSREHDPTIRALREVVRGVWGRGARDAAPKRVRNAEVAAAPERRTGGSRPKADPEAFSNRA
ncbi:MAG TPA: LysR family transcriptional regulator [Burkholderiaceae bacterium]|nr:LysR family transcriptional regulator [Burkholderiaceae bacterium]